MPVMIGVGPHKASHRRPPTKRGLLNTATAGHSEGPGTVKEGEQQLWPAADPPDAIAGRVGKLGKASSGVVGELLVLQVRP